MHQVAERIQHAAKKNPSLDTDSYQSLHGLLEFCDLRELQEIIANKTLWLSFEKRFGSKEALKAKFDQLAELRNGIRHSRLFNEVVRKKETPPSCGLSRLCETSWSNPEQVCQTSDWGGGLVPRSLQQPISRRKLAMSRAQVTLRKVDVSTRHVQRGMAQQTL